MVRLLENPRIISALCEKYGMTKDEKYSYIVDANNQANVPLDIEGRVYTLKFFSGCYFPYIVEEIDITKKGTVPTELPKKDSPYAKNPYIAYGDNEPTMKKGRWIRQSGPTSYDVLHVDVFYGNNTAYIIGKCTIDCAKDEWIDHDEIKKDYKCTVEKDPVAFVLSVVDYYGMKECKGEQTKLDLKTAFATLKYLGIKLIPADTNRYGREKNKALNQREA